MADAGDIGSYRLLRVLGTGSFATVWLAHDDVLDRQVAVKVLADNWSRDNEVRRRFLSEARVLLTVDSPRIVRGFQLGETPGGQPYLVMAWADRGTLDDRIRQREAEGRVFTAQETVGIAAEVTAALSDVHTSGHLHRDVKPTNVLIRSTSTPRHIAGLAADETIVLGDFGLARGLDLTALTLVAGSPGYVAPEQAAGLTQIDRRADLYSLGRIMLQLLTGDAGGRATTMAAAAAETIDVPGAFRRLEGLGAPRPPEELVTLVTALVANDPDDRPSSAHEVQARLSGIAGRFAGPFGPPVAPPPVAAPGAPTGTQLGAAAPTARRRRTPLLVALGAAALVAAAVLAVTLLRGGAGSGSGDSTEPTSSTAPAPTVEPTTTLGAVVVPISDANGSSPAATIEPATTEPATRVATAAGPPNTDPGTTEPPASSTEAPAVITEPATTEPATTEPATTQPATTEPATTEPATTEPATTEPATTAAASTEPATTIPATTAPSATAPPTTEPTSTEPSTTPASTTPPSSTPSTAVGPPVYVKPSRSLVLPPFALVDTGIGAPNVMTGSFTGPPSEFVSGLLALNPAWTAATPPTPDSLSAYDFQLSTAVRTARVVAFQDAAITSRTITDFSVEYLDR